MEDSQKGIDESISIARRWCEARGTGWSVERTLGKGGTAPVFEVNTPDGPQALKVYEAEFSSDKKGEIEQKRVGTAAWPEGPQLPFPRAGL